MKKKLSRNPVRVNDDVWFYLYPKSIGFVVWAGPKGNRHVRQFKITHEKLRKYL